MVELLNSVMSFVTIFSIRAFLIMVNIPTLFRLIDAQGSPSIFLIIVIIRALLQVMVSWIKLAGDCFEEGKIQEWNALSHLDVLSAVITVLLN